MAQIPGFSSVAKFVKTATLNPANVTAGSVATETFTVTGLRLNQMIPVVHAPSLEAGLTLISSRITADDTLELTFQNNTGGDLNPASQAFEIICL